MRHERAAFQNGTQHTAGELQMKDDGRGGAASVAEERGRRRSVGRQ